MTFMDHGFGAPVVGNDRYRADMRQFAGLLFAISICACFSPLINIATLISAKGTNTTVDDTPFWSLIGSGCIVAVGLFGMCAGYFALVHDYSNTLLTAWVLVLVQTSWISYINDMVVIGLTAKTGSGFGLDRYNPSKSDTWIVGASGIMGIAGFGFAFIGSLAFYAFSLFAFQAGRPGSRNAAYYRSRLSIYSFAILVAGTAQVMVGSIILYKFTSGPIVPPVTVGVFVVTYPEMSIAVGCVYAFNGIWGMVRTMMKPTDSSFQSSLAFQWLVTVAVMILTQISYLPASTMAAAAPVIAAMTLGASITPAFLDYKARTTPEFIDVDYYGGDMRDEAPFVKEVMESDDEEDENHAAYPGDEPLETYQTPVTQPNLSSDQSLISYLYDDGEESA